jgi:hypothetical protein
MHIQGYRSMIKTKRLAVSKSNFDKLFTLCDH